MCFFTKLLRNIIKLITNPVQTLENLVYSDFYWWIIYAAIVGLGYSLIIDLAHGNPITEKRSIFGSLIIVYVMCLLQWVAQIWTDYRLAGCPFSLNSEKEPYNFRQSQEQNTNPQSLPVQRGTERKPAQRETEQLPVQRTEQIPVQRGTEQVSVQRGTEQSSVQRGTEQASVQKGTKQASVQRGTEQIPVERGTEQIPVQRETEHKSEHIFQVPVSPAPRPLSSPVLNQQQNILYLQKRILESSQKLNTDAVKTNLALLSLIQQLQIRHDLSHRPGEISKQTRIESQNLQRNVPTGSNSSTSLSKTSEARPPKRTSDGLRKMPNIPISVRDSFSKSNEHNLRSLLQSPRRSMENPRGFFQFMKEKLMPSTSCETIHKKVFICPEYGASTSGYQSKNIDSEITSSPSSSHEVTSEVKHIESPETETDISISDENSEAAVPDKSSPDKSVTDLLKEKCLLNIKSKSLTSLEKYSNDESDVESTKSSKGSRSGSSEESTASCSSSPEKSNFDEDLKVKQSHKPISKLPEKFYYKKGAKRTDSATGSCSSSPEKSNFDEDLEVNQSHKPISKLPEKFYYKKGAKRTDSESDQSDINKSPEKSYEETMAEFYLSLSKAGENTNLNKSGSSPTAKSTAAVSQNVSETSFKKTPTTSELIDNQPIKRKNETSSEDDDAKSPETNDAILAKHRSKIAKLNEDKNKDDSV